MCNSVTLVPIPNDYVWALENFDPTHPEYDLDEQGRKCFCIDSCIVPALLAVWAAGFKTLGCCCGHGSGSGVISLDLGWDRTKPMFPHHCVLCGLLHEEPKEEGVGDENGV